MDLAIILLLIFLGLALVLCILLLVAAFVWYSSGQSDQKKQHEKKKEVKAGNSENIEGDVNYGYYKQESPQQLEEKYKAMQRAQENQSRFQMRLMPLPPGSEDNSAKTIKLVSEKKIPFPSIGQKNENFKML